MSTKDNLRCSCKECCRKYHPDNKELIKEQRRQHYIDNQENLRKRASTHNCGKYFTPTNQQIMSRSSSIKGSALGEHSLYCSDGCKKSCGTYGQYKYPKGFKTNTSREVQPQLRKLVLERDNWKCQTCDNVNNKPLHCHHYNGIELNPTESADMDNCVTLCKKCHNKVHKDCNMRRKKCIKNDL